MNPEIEENLRVVYEKSSPNERAELQKVLDSNGRVTCTRCTKIIDSKKGWWHGWPLIGRVWFRFGAQIFKELTNSKHADKADFDWWKEGHPAMTKNEAQESCFRWDTDINSPYHLCRDCHREFIQMVGRFFRIPERKKEIEDESKKSEDKQ